MPWRQEAFSAGAAVSLSEYWDYPDDLALQYAIWTVSCGVADLAERKSLARFLQTLL